MVWRSLPDNPQQGLRKRKTSSTDKPCRVTSTLKDNHMWLCAQNRVAQPSTQNATRNPPRNAEERDRASQGSGLGDVYCVVVS